MIDDGVKKPVEPVDNEANELADQSDTVPDHSAKKHDSTSQVQKLEAQIKELKEADLRSKADYHNLVRRTQEERSKLVKLATVGLVEELLQPLDHLSLAAGQLKDTGLDMVVKQFWIVLNQHGLEETQVMGQPFDAHTMEVVDKQGDEDIVTGVVSRGYRLNGEVIRHAKVVVGGQTAKNT